uniref:Uncharacterized protein n=1 Tax=Arundo donax TaxID=35708 RepID=A0A0A9HJ76_ARUDO
MKCSQQKVRSCCSAEMGLGQTMSSLTSQALQDPEGC